MSIRSMLAGAAAALLALLPAAALADLQINAAGFERAVTSSTQGPTCEVDRGTGGLTIDCPDGTRGTILLYRDDDAQTPACELDFWYGLGNSGGQQWRAQIPQRSTPSGTACRTHWQYANVLQVN